MRESASSLPAFSAGQIDIVEPGIAKNDNATARTTTANELSSYYGVALT